MGDERPGAVFIRKDVRIGSGTDRVLDPDAIGDVRLSTGKGPAR
jgi:hypothetical protein